MTGLLLTLVLAASPSLEPAREAYQSGELPRARSLLEALLQPLQLTDPTEEAEAHLLLAATYHAQEDTERAEAEVVRALAANPDVKLDPLVYPPDFVAYVERVHVLHQQRISELSAGRRTPAVAPWHSTTPQPSPAQVARIADRPVSRGWYLVPFGVGHFKHGQRTKGTFLAVTQGVAFTVSAASLGAALALRGPDGLYSAGDASAARGLNVTYLVGAYAFAALYAYGVLDGWLLDPEPPASRGPQG
ncbi:tetratricopeptide repeat protein [Pyxidicoccus sp. MSG2]|uniref:tetratricopeptide repeat protein n=1 Tax=Pyxidicoccus sp. MSG2 TaxID=2996790 RepID=UPI00226EDA85|nr:tetratricopeptide repeat protein [Pyxidicoccus sp. MSG2]MCY1022487.1 tetratricopeptide repeat protein [Pyxidicoccus sp. MSG2]